MCACAYVFMQHVCCFCAASLFVLCNNIFLQLHMFFFEGSYVLFFQFHMFAFSDFIFICISPISYVSFLQFHMFSFFDFIFILYLSNFIVFHMLFFSLIS